MRRVKRTTGRDLEWGQFCKTLEALSHIIDNPDAVKQIKKVNKIKGASNVDPTIKLRDMLIESGAMTHVNRGIYRLA